MSNIVKVNFAEHQTGNLALSVEPDTGKTTRRSHPVNKPEFVHPIRNKADIVRFEQAILNGGKRFTDVRNWVLFVVGINVALRASDLHNLKVSNFYDKFGQFRDRYFDTEQKTERTHKKRDIYYNNRVREVVEFWVKYANLSGDDYLFQSQVKTSKYNEKTHQMDEEHYGITPRHIHRMMNDAAAKIGYKYNVGSHTLRKTWAYQYFVANGESATAIAKLQLALNHVNVRDTYRYIGIDDKELDKMYGENELGNTVPQFLLNRISCSRS